MTGHNHKQLPQCSVEAVEAQRAVCDGRWHQARRSVNEEVLGAAGHKNDKVTAAAGGRARALGGGLASLYRNEPQYWVDKHHRVLLCEPSQRVIGKVVYSHADYGLVSSNCENEAAR